MSFSLNLSSIFDGTRLTCSKVKVFMKCGKCDGDAVAVVVAAAAATKGYVWYRVGPEEAEEHVLHRPGFLRQFPLYSTVVVVVSVSPHTKPAFPFSPVCFSPPAPVAAAVEEEDDDDDDVVDDEAPGTVNM
ncbi:hypothetical protein RUM43_006353 [Polyplax serrata]|uniref:Uncharacterized protein n=1 Tax=Polyplax serrata TaxID=468196 RepID=A0AAN8S916_POLSC